MGLSTWMTLLGRLKKKDRTLQRSRHVSYALFGQCFRLFQGSGRAGNETKMMQYINLSIAGVFLLLQFQGYSTAILKGDGEHFSLGGGCPQGWMTYKGSCYKSFEQRKTWDEAQKTCQGYGAILATIPDSGVNNALAGLLPHLHLYVDKQAWIGLNDRDTEGTYIWLGTNREATWTNWDDGEPNNSVSGNEDCVALLPDGYWNDAPCSTLLKFICEKSV